LLVLKWVMHPIPFSPSPSISHWRCFTWRLLSLISFHSAMTLAAFSICLSDIFTLLNNLNIFPFCPCHLFHIGAAFLGGY
jgi:hypothetical protein